MGENDTEVRILIELIKTNDKNSTDKFNSLCDRLSEHGEENKEEFKEIKRLITGYNEKIIKDQTRIFEESIEPMRTMLDNHEKSIADIIKEKESYVKTEICKHNDKKIQDYFRTLTIKIVIYNLIFLVIYMIILYNSNLNVNWGNVFELLGSIKKLF